MIKETVQADLKTAMKGGDTATRDALRMLLAAFTVAEKQQGTSLDDEAAGAVVLKTVKQTKNSIEEYRRLELAETVTKLETELAVYERYAPARMGEPEVQAIVTAAVAEAGATGPQDMGKVMKLVLAKVGTSADGGMVSRLVKAALTR